MMQWLVARVTMQMHQGIRKAGMKKEGKLEGASNKPSEKKIT